MPTWKALLPDGGNLLDADYRRSLTDDVRRVFHKAFEHLQVLQAAAVVGDPDELIMVLLESPDFKQKSAVFEGGHWVEIEKDFSKEVKMSRSQALTALNQMQALAAGEDLGPIVEGEADLESFQSVDQVLNEIRNLKPTLEALLPAASIPELDDCMEAFFGFERLVGIKRSLSDGEFDSYGETIRYKITIPGIGLREFQVRKDLLGGMMQ